MARVWTPEHIEDVLLSLEELAAARLQDRREHLLVAATDPIDIRKQVQATFDFAAPQDTSAIVESLLTLLETCDLDSTHPRYFGLFNPPARPIGAVADALVAMLSPQVGTRGHAPAAVALEEHVLAFFAARIGFDGAKSEAHFTSGGQEANTTAVVAALNFVFPELAEQGLRGLTGQPCLYVSDAAHHSFQKATKILGLGVHGVRHVATGEHGALDLDALRVAVARDRAAGDVPFMVVGTAGSTGTGSIDPLVALADFAADEALWFHVDAAWGGGALMSDRLRPLLQGIERADSVTWDAHKWLSVPMGAGMVFFRERGMTASACEVTTGYVPDVGAGDTEPYLRTLQWSRRFIGLKVLMSLAQLGVDGYARLVEHQCEMGALLKDKLLREGWHVRQDSPLPVLCITRSDVDEDVIASRVQQRGRAWVSTVALANGLSAVRVCITSYQTQPDDLDTLVEELQLAVERA